MKDTERTAIKATYIGVNNLRRIENTQQFGVEAESVPTIAEAVFDHADDAMAVIMREFGERAVRGPDGKALRYELLHVLTNLAAKAASEAMAGSNAAFLRRDQAAAGAVLKALTERA